MNEVTEFLKRDTSPDLEARSAARKQTFIQALHTLYARIDDWLAEAQAQRAVVDVHRGEIQIVEQQSGACLAPEMSFTAANTTVRFIPEGAFIIGAEGRVDVHATTGRNAFLVLNNGKWLFVNPRTHQHPELDQLQFLELLKYLLER